MKADVKRFKDKYGENIDNIPLDDLGVIVYNMHMEYLNNLRDGVDHELFASIKDLLWGVEYGKYGYLIHKLYVSTLLFHFKEIEEWYRQDKMFRLKLSLGVLLEVTIFKLNYNAIRDFKITGDIRNLDIVLSSIEKSIKSRAAVIESSKDELRLLSDILSGDRDEFELYRSKEDFELLENNHLDLFNVMKDEVYRDETFKSKWGDDEYIKTVLMDVLSGVYFKKDDDGIYLVNFEDFE